jgi:hypothetical protein
MFISASCIGKGGWVFYAKPSKSARVVPGTKAIQAAGS